MKFKYLALFRSFPSRMILFQPSGSIVALWVANFMIWRSNALWWTNWFKICSVLKNQLSKNHSYPFYLQCDVLSGVVLLRIITIAGLKSFWEQFPATENDHTVMYWVTLFHAFFHPLVFCLKVRFRKKSFWKWKKNRIPKSSHGDSFSELLQSLPLSENSSGASCSRIVCHKFTSRMEGKYRSVFVSICLKMKKKSNRKILTWRFVHQALLWGSFGIKLLAHLRFENSVSQNYQVIELNRTRLISKVR